MRKYICIISILATVLNIDLILAAKQSGDESPYSSSYIIPSEAGIKMSINIWGEVRNPGQYLIPYSINLDLISLLSLAGGPLTGANLKKVTLIREIEKDGESGKIVTVNLKEYIKTGNRKLLPAIEPNDTVIIEPTFWSSVKGSSTYLQTILSITTLSLQILNSK